MEADFGFSLILSKWGVRVFLALVPTPWPLGPLMFATLWTEKSCPPPKEGGREALDQKSPSQPFSRC